MYTADQLSDYFNALANETGSCLTNLKLQKLLYYAQGWHLAIFDKPMFADKIEAWVHGPVVPSIYRRFKAHAAKPIDCQPEKPTMDKDVRDFMQELCSVYFARDAYELELMTHREEPWIKARKGLRADVNSSNIITTSDMKSYFKSLMAA